MGLIAVARDPAQPLRRLVHQAADPNRGGAKPIGVAGPGDPAAQVREWLERTAEPEGLVVLSWGATHRDSRVPALRAQWDFEEACRALATRVLVLRLAPMLGPESPLWLQLRAGGARGERPFQPVAESDVVETLRRVERDGAPWGEWYDVAGREAVTLTELSHMAARPGSARAPGSWEPGQEILGEQKLVDPVPWIRRFGIEPAPLAEQLARWAA